MLYGEWKTDCIFLCDSIDLTKLPSDISKLQLDLNIEDGVVVELADGKREKEEKREE